MKKYRKQLIILSLFFLVSLLSYFSNLNDFFVSDDFDWIHLSLQGEHPFWKVLFGNYYGVHGQGGTFRPVVSIYFWITSHLFGLTPIGYHIASIAFHSANAYIVYLLSKHLFRYREYQEKVSLLAGLLFTFMPNHAEAVIWIAAIGDPLATFFYLSALLLSIQKKRWLSLILFALSLGTKEIALSLPLVLIAYELVINENYSVKSIVKKTWSYFTIAGAFILYRMWALGLLFGYYGASSITINSLKVVTMFLNLAANPILYGTWRISVVNTIIASPTLTMLALLTLLTFITVIFKQKLRTLGFLLSYWFINVLIVLPLGFGLRDDEGERYGYIASVACAIIFAWGISLLWKKKPAFGLITLLIITTSFVYNVSWKTQAWNTASRLSNDIITAFDEIPWDNYKKVYAVALPETYQGAQVLRNGFTQAHQLFTKSKTPTERIPIYSTETSSKYNQHYFDSFERLPDGFHAISKGNKYVFTGKATETLPDYKYELWNYNYDTFMSNTIRVQFRNGREFDWARNEILILYFEGNQLKKLSF